MFSKSCEYALLAVLFIALNQKEKRLVGLKQIVTAQKVPSHFLSKILHELVRNKILDSYKGPQGGYRLARETHETRLIEIIEVIDGLDIFEKCCIGLKKCSDDHPCPVHREFVPIRHKIRDLLSNKTIEAFITDVEKGRSFVSINGLDLS
jgi:Rrf2 family protein